MSSEIERQLIGELFISGWNNETPVEVPNQTYTPDPDESWVRLSFTSGNPFSLELGKTNATQRYPGTVFVQVFTPVNTGDAKARALADKAADIFVVSDIMFPDSSGSIRFRTPRVQPIGTSEGWYQVNVSVNFIRDQLF